MVKGQSQTPKNFENEYLENGIDREKMLTEVR